MRITSSRYRVVLKNIIFDSVAQDLLAFLWNLKVRFRVYKGPSINSINSQLNVLCTLKHVFNTLFNIIIPSEPKPSSSFGFPSA